MNLAERVKILFKHRDLIFPKLATSDFDGGSLIATALHRLDLAEQKALLQELDGAVRDYLVADLLRRGLIYETQQPDQIRPQTLNSSSLQRRLDSLHDRATKLRDGIFAKNVTAIAINQELCSIVESNSALAERLCALFGLSPTESLVMVEGEVLQRTTITEFHVNATMDRVRSVLEVLCELTSAGEGALRSRAGGDGKAQHKGKPARAALLKALESVMKKFDTKIARDDFIGEVTAVYRTHLSTGGWEKLSKLTYDLTFTHDSIRAKLRKKER